VALVADSTGILYHQALGHFTYSIPPPQNNDINPPMTIDTRFDMASCTKVSTVTTAIAQFYQRGELALDTKVGDILGSQFNVYGKTNITILNLLLHNSGFYSDPNPFWNTPSFGCPQTSHYNPLENFDCSEKIYASLLSQKLQHNIGTTYLYSDLNFMTLMYVLGDIVEKKGHVSTEDLREDCKRSALDAPGLRKQCFFEAYVRKFILEPVGMDKSGFGYLNKEDWSECAPAENDTVFFHDTYQGQVSDGNAFAMGGISGHAGFFSTTSDLYKLLQKILFATPSDQFLNKTTVDLFIKEYNHSQSSRALGWNTNDPTVNDMGWNQSCGSLSPTTFMHIGYTGTMMCVDPERRVIMLLLTNRVYPTDKNNKDGKVRREFGTAVQIAYDAGRIILDK